eukprot:Platyproteum_vivax@DN4298_c0_g1_i1.p1
MGETIDLRTLRMTDLPEYVDEEKVHNFFHKKDRLLSIRLVNNAETGKCAGYGFLDFATMESARRCLDKYSGQQVPETNIIMKLDWASTSTGAAIDTYQVYFGNLSPDVTDGDLYMFCTQYSNDVLNAKVIVDSWTGKHRGYGFARYSTNEAAYQAVEDMQGGLIGRWPVVIREAYRRRIGSRDDERDFDNPSNTTLFIGHLNFLVTSDELREAFNPFGQVESIKRLPGIAFLSFTDHIAALAALTHMEGYHLRNQRMALGWGRMRPFGTDPTSDPLYNTSSQGYNAEWHASMTPQSHFQAPEVPVTPCLPEVTATHDGGTVTVNSIGLTPQDVKPLLNMYNYVEKNSKQKTSVSEGAESAYWLSFFLRSEDVAKLKGEDGQTGGVDKLKSEDVPAEASVEDAAAEPPKKKKKSRKNREEEMLEQLKALNDAGPVDILTLNQQQHAQRAKETGGELGLLQFHLQEQATSEAYGTPLLPAYHPATQFGAKPPAPVCGDGLS